MDVTNVTTSYMLTYLIVCFICTVSGVTIVNLITPDMSGEAERIRFKEFVMFFVVYALTNAVNVLCNTYKWPTIGIIFSVINMASIMLTFFEWFAYVEVRIGSKLFDDKKIRFLMAIPLIIQLGIIITTPFTHLDFYYENGVYTRGPLYIPVLMLLLPYIFFASGHVAKNMHKAKTHEQKKTYILLILFMVFPIGGGLIDVFIPHLPIMELMSLLGIIVVFMNMQQANIFVDSLTEMNNRRRATEYISERLQTVDEEGPFILFMADIDHFKKINDHFGHTEGDNALRCVAQALKSFGSKRKCLIARWGGDEFVIIGYQKNLGDTGNVIREINESIKDMTEKKNLPYHITMSIGFADCSVDGMTQEELIAAADKMMYGMKRS